MVIDKELLDKLTAQAKDNERLRMNFDLRDSVEDECQRMLNAIEPGSIVPVHRHPLTSEDVVILRGRAIMVLFDDLGNETTQYLLIPGCLNGNSNFKNDAHPAIHIPRGQYHTCRSLESGTVIIEFKNTKYDPSGTEVLKKNN